MLRITTRLAHSRSAVKFKDAVEENKLELPKNKNQFILLPVNAKVQYKKLLNDQAIYEAKSNESVFNQYIDGDDHSIGIIACGIAFNYIMENFPDGCPYPIVKVSQYPIPRKHISNLSKNCERLLVLEEGYPIIEEVLKGYLNSEPVSGRLDGTLPRDGELNPDYVAKALGLTYEPGKDTPDIVAGRPPALCPGCSHHDVFVALNQVMENYTKGRVFSDIGCYTIGALPPYSAINTCVDMGASITMAKGAADAGLIPAIAMIGDSTFTHSGMTGLLDAVYENSPVTIIISDNESTSMTGGQDSSAKGRIESICEGIGVDPEHIHVVLPLRKNHDEIVRIMQQELDYNGVSVIIPRRVCVKKHAQDVKMKRKNQNS